MSDNKKESLSEKPVSRRSVLKWSGALAAAGIVGVGLGFGVDLLVRPNTTSTTTQTVSKTSTITATQTATGYNNRDGAAYNDILHTASFITSAIECQFNHSKSCG